MYSCKTTSCAIAISKAEFPVAMNCPVCETLLSEVIESLSKEDIDLIDSLPYVIAYPLQQTLLEKHLPQRINLFKDTFLNYLKYLGLLSASEFFNSDIKDKGMVLLFQQNLIETAFGKWNHYIREIIKFLKEQNHTLFCPELASYYELVETGNKSKKHKGEIEIIDANGDIQLKKQEATSIGMLINFRNRYLGHGLTLDYQKAEALWQEYFPIFRNLLEQLSFAKDYSMLKRENGITYLLHSAEISAVDYNNASQSSIWIQNKEGKIMNILPFFIVPGEVSLAKEDKEQMFAYESYTGKTIKFFSPEGTEKQTSGKLLEKLNLLLRDKQKEVPFAPHEFTKEEFLNRIADENKLLLETLINEKKIIPGVYQHREEMEIKLREWIGARTNIFFIAAEAGSGKTNLLVEIQQQYSERDLPSLLIRAGRMEKESLKEQIAYLLNIDLGQGIKNYSSLAGTQAKPTFILIDGLNEANHAEAIWQEILSLSNIFEAGSLKFVVANRANTKADLDRYLISDKQQELLYGENKHNEKGLSAYSYWLTALDMKEMKGTWENYVAKDKARFRPQFTFDAIAEFDRGIYNQINNPLILRLFLEIYNGKALPKKGNKHLHIWSDWFKTFSEAEQTFFTLLANAVWNKGENELLLDDLLQNEILKSYLTSDIINAPYQRLKNLGWISSYTKDLNSYIGFTVEGSLLYLLGVQLQNQTPKIDLEYVDNILQKNNKISTSAIETFLCEEALMGDIDLVTDLIDIGIIDLCIESLFIYLIKFGVESTISILFKNPSKNDIKAVLLLNKELIEKELRLLQKTFLEHIMCFNKYETDDEILIAIYACQTLNKVESDEILKKININNKIIQKNYSIPLSLGLLEAKFKNFEKAFTYYDKCLFLFENEVIDKNIDYPIIYNNIGLLWHQKGNLDNALINYEKSLQIFENLFETNHHIKIADIYNNIGVLYWNKGDYDTTLEYYNKSMNVYLRNIGNEHSEVAMLFDNIGILWFSKGDFVKALEYCNKCLKILLKIFGKNNPKVATSYNNIGYIYFNEGNYENALNYYQECLNIRIITLGKNHFDLADIYYEIGNCNIKLLNYSIAIEYLLLAYNLDKKSDFTLKIAQCYEELNENEKGLYYYIQSAEIRKNEFSLDDEATQEAITNAKRLAKELDKKSELPEWMK